MTQMFYAEFISLFDFNNFGHKSWLTNQNDAWESTIFYSFDNSDCSTFLPIQEEPHSAAQHNSICLKGSSNHCQANAKRT